MPFLYGKGEIYGSIFFCKDLSLKYGKIIISMRIISSYFDGENILLHSEFFLFVSSFLLKRNPLRFIVQAPEGVLKSRSKTELVYDGCTFYGIHYGGQGLRAQLQFNRQILYKWINLI